MEVGVVVETLREIQKDYEIDLAFRRQTESKVSKKRIDMLGSAMKQIEEYKRLKKKNFKLETGFLELLNNRQTNIKWLEELIINSKKDPYNTAKKKAYKEVLKKLKEGGTLQKGKF